MKRNPLFYAKTNANRSKIARAKKILFLSLLCLFSISLITTLSLANPKDAKGFAKCAGGALISLGIVPLVAGVRGTKAVNGFDESETDFTARKGAEAPEAFVVRCLKAIEDEVKILKEAKDNPDLIKKYEELKENITALKKDSELLQNVKLEVEKATVAIEALKESAAKKGGTMKQQIYDFVKDNAQKIADAYKNRTGQVQFKVVAAMSTTSATNPDGIPDLVGVQSAPPSNVNLRTSIVNDLVSTFPTSLAAYAYTETVPKDGNYEFVAEKESKPQIDFKIETRYAQPKKVAAYMKLSEESVTDIPGMQSIAYDYMRKKHDLKRQSGILFGDDTGDNLKGATLFGRLFSAGDMANRVATPNFMDVVNAAITDIFTTHNYTDEMPYMANLVMLNPIDFFIELVAAKDGFGRPLYPMASLFNRVTIGGVTIVPFEDIPAGKIFVADMSKYNITDYVGYTIRIGWINDDFITNQFCIVGESRLHAFVKKLDEQAFIYDDIDTIEAAITGI